MWCFAALSGSPSDIETRRQIISRFTKLYEEVGEPEGVTLFNVTDSTGHFAGLALTKQAAKKVPELLQEFIPWHEMNPPGNLG